MFLHGCLGKCGVSQSLSQLTNGPAVKFDSPAWYHWECSNELDKNYQLLKDGNVHKDCLSS